jgi:MoaA/NifB/PqqE/SkfB family radical SAM enzyme
MVHLTRKIAVNLGQACNAKCAFCYFHHSVHGGTQPKYMTVRQVKQTLRKAKNYGAREIEFTGGEPSIRKDLVDLVRFAKEKLNYPVVSLLTNGIRLSDRAYLSMLAEAGVDDILFSVHGHGSGIHDRITGVTGSHEKILQAMEISKRLGIRVRTNTVICSFNSGFVSETVKLLIERGADNINLVMLNPVLQARDLNAGIFIAYEDGAREIKRAIERYHPQLPHLNIRYLPFCYLPGYERFIVNNDQCNFDPDEWNYFIGNRVRFGTAIAACLGLIGLSNLKYKQFAARFGVLGMLMAGTVRFLVYKNKFKSRKCSHCAYEFVCDYIWKVYYRHFGDRGIKPIPGTKIRNPANFINAAGTRRPGELWGGVTQK